MMVAIVGLLLTALGWQQQPGAVELRAVRFYRGAAGTLVDGFCRVPYALLDTLPGNRGGGAYRVEITVRDSTGLELTSQAWSQVVTRDLLRLPDASAVEHFAFAATTGRYDIEVVVTDSASGRRSWSTTSVNTYGKAAPPASDVLLTTGIRRGGSQDTLARAGEIRKGSVFLASAIHPVLTLQDEKLYYYLELYPGRPQQAQLTARARAADGRDLFSARPQADSVSRAGGIVASALDLAGLPPGAYHLAIEVHYPDTTFTREGEFEVAGFEAAARVAKAGPADTAFASSAEAQLDSLYQPLVHIMEDSERGMFAGLSLQGKRNYLRRFWARRNPSPGTAGNEAQVAYYAKIADANRRFREGGAGSIPGWRTDRGRILIRYGEPDEVKGRSTAGPTPPYEFWKYTHGRQRVFIFVDKTGFGHYELIYTNERREPSDPRWEAVVGPDVKDLF